jgi:hypothetical protein
VPIREIRVETLGQLVDEITPREPDPVTGRRRYSGIFHGSTDASYPLLTSLDRLGGVTPPHTKADLEEHILRSFVRYSRPYLTNEPHSEWELLVVAQHHRVPTRLLDWSYSPLVAAHFATGSRHGECDRAVWALDWHQLHRAFGFSELALLIDELGAVRNGPGATPWDLFRESGGRREFACMIDPPSISPRIVAQAGVFTLASDKSRSFDAFLEEHGLGEALTRYVIPADLVSFFREQLDLVGMDERRIFPDLHGVAEELRRYYS